MKAGGGRLDQNVGASAVAFDVIKPLEQPLGHLESTNCGRSGTVHRKSLRQILAFRDALGIQWLVRGPNAIVARS